MVLCHMMQGNYAGEEVFYTEEAVAAVMDGLDEENEGNMLAAHEAEICILPPEDGAESETEAINEDRLRAVELSDVCGQLAAFTGGDDNDSVVTSSGNSTEAPAMDELKNQTVKRKRKRKTSTTSNAKRQRVR